MNVIQKRLEGFDQIFNNLAPIGSNLKRIEREVDVSEKEYLSVLHGLNMAKLRQQSLEMSNNLTITDSPFLPLEPLPSKRMMLVAMSLVATFIVSLAGIIAKSLLGKTVQTPGRAEKYTGLQFLGAFPDYDKLSKNIIVELLDKANLSQLSSNIRLHLKNTLKKDQKTQLIIAGSNKRNEGKSYCVDKISKAIADRDGEVLWLNPDALSITIQANVTTSPYVDDVNFIKAASFKDGLGNLELKTENFRYIILELNELTRYALPEGILAEADLNLFILDSERVWSESDSRALNNFTRNTAGKSLIILNKVDIDRMESIIGEIPKTRSKFRRIAKRVVTFDFKRA